MILQVRVMDDSHLRVRVRETCADRSGLPQVGLVTEKDPLNLLRRHLGE